MINYTILEKTEIDITLQIEDSSQWNFKGEKDIKIKKMKLDEAVLFFNKLKEQRQKQLELLTEKINSEISSISDIISKI